MLLKIKTGSTCNYAQMGGKSHDYKKCGVLIEPLSRLKSGLCTP